MPSRRTRRTLRTFLLVLHAAALAAVTPALAAESHGSHNHSHGSAAKSAAAKPAIGSGLVRRINLADGTLTITHGPIPALNMGAMTMPFKARDKSLLEGIAPMQKIEFELIQQGDDYIVTSIKKVAN